MNPENNDNISHSAQSTRRVTFLHTPNRFYSEVQNNGVIFMPVWAYTLASHLPEDGNYDLGVFDTRLTPIEEAAPADVFLMSGINQDYPDLVAAREYLAEKFPSAKFVLGGPICWSFHTAGDLEKLSMFDHVIIGDGEGIIADLLESLFTGETVEHTIEIKERFPLRDARRMSPRLMDKTIGQYYGAVVEVSRGCPFLCEFCDIRILPDNNRPHLKSPEMIVEEVDHICKLGVRSFLFACDNFIGDLVWAEKVVDGLLEWRERTGETPVFYTWLTINLYKAPDLMRKMRKAGFDVLFIGVESFNANSLLETAKVQNTAAGVAGAIREIQSFGFPIVAGLIFGFDSDDASSFTAAKEGLVQSGLLSGDPSLLTALPGTPLFRRMRLAGRLREVRYGLGGYKYQTNIRYLMPRDEMIRSYLDFCAFLVDGRTQLKRLEAFLELQKEGNHVPLTGSYFSLKTALPIIWRNPKAVWLAVQRLALFARTPSNVWYALRGLWMAARMRDIPGRYSYVQFWIAVWSTLLVKYKDLKVDDFDIDSVHEPIEARHILPDGYMTEWDEAIPLNKIKAQRRETARSLQNIRIGV